MSHRCCQIQKGVWLHSGTLAALVKNMMSLKIHKGKNKILALKKAPQVFQKVITYKI